MITDPLTLGVSGHTNTFDVTEVGPGSKTIRLASGATIGGETFVFERLSLTISHEMNKNKTRRRSLLRLDIGGARNVTLGSLSPVTPPFAYVVVDRPVDELAGDTVLAAKELLSRIVGFLTANATGAPDHTFAAVPHVSEFLAGEP